MRSPRAFVSCLLALLAFSLAGPAARAEDGAPKPGPELYDDILAEYVDGDYFDYARLLESPEDMAKFEAFLDWQATADLDSMTREEQIAFYINAYNSCCIQAVLDHYPVHTPMDIEGFFDEITFPVAGEELTVSQIEYDRLIANYQDMRAHFAVVCADRGCLSLKPGAYTGEALDADLEAAAERFVSDPRHFELVTTDDGQQVVKISKIFQWYGEKFLARPRAARRQRPPRAVSAALGR